MVFFVLDRGESAKIGLICALLVNPSERTFIPIYD